MITLLILFFVAACIRINRQPAGSDVTASRTSLLQILTDMTTKGHLVISYLLTMLAAVLLISCSATKHVPEGELLLERVRITTDNDTIATAELYNFLRQTPNHKVLGFAKLQLATYNLSGSDSTKWYNRWLQSIGQPPVLYDSTLTEKSRKQLEQALINRGYMDVNVRIDTIADRDKRLMDVTYTIQTGAPHIVSSISYNIPDPAIASIIFVDSALITVREGDNFDRNRLDAMRGAITQRLRDHGYYDFNKEYITLTADTVRGQKDIALTFNIRPARVSVTGSDGVVVPTDSLRYAAYRIDKVYFVTDYTQEEIDRGFRFTHQDTVRYRNIYVLYGADHYIRPSILEEKCMIQAGAPYSAREVERTYEALGQLGIIKYVNIVLRPAHDAPLGGTRWLDAYVLMSRNKKQMISFELEGTNSEGDLGFGAGVTYQHRNLNHGSELFTAKLRASYESLSGNFDGLVNNRYTEYAGEVGVTYPKFMFPLLPRSVKKRIRSTTEFAVSMNYQERPEYTRIIAGAAWRYKWSRARMAGYSTRHQFDLVDVNYVKLPKSTLNFLDSIAPSNPLLRYSYEDHFIMRMGYTLTATNKRIPTGLATSTITQPYVNTLRMSVEMAGNLLYGISSLLHERRQDGAYKIFGIQYAQYVKGEADYTYTINMNSRNSVAMHIGMGVAVPYLNSKMVPFEKRFYAGGANSVRGWNVRTLGPGCYDSRNTVTNFINQCGDIMLNMSIEYRAKLFWVLEGATFIDAGNIWTIRQYVNQPGGLFRIGEFYKQIAASYGVGLRFDFSYFLLRFDLGVKAHNPARNQQEWPLLHPNLRRDATLHFAVGYPF